MTAILVAVGLGTVTPAQVKTILESRDPLGKHQTRVAPAHGLFLKSVHYEGLEGLGERSAPGEAPTAGWVPAGEPLVAMASQPSPTILEARSPACAQQERQGLPARAA